MQRTCIGDRVGGRAHIGLNGMRQGVHARGSCKALRHANHELGVVHCQGGSEAPIHQGHPKMPKSWMEAFVTVMWVMVLFTSVYHRIIHDHPTIICCMLPHIAKSDALDAETFQWNSELTFFSQYL